MPSFDLRAAINAISDVTQNRPKPIREFDQIYMKVADMVIQADYLARRFDGLDVVFIGDGDSIALSALHLRKSGVIDYGPGHIHVLDFDERIVRSIVRFAENNDFVQQISASLYNVIDPLPEGLLHSKDAFYTNPPWGASNGGDSVFVFMERGIEAVKENASGMIVIADSLKLKWTQEVLYGAQRLASDHGFLVSEMIPEQHLYHLDDAPDLKSCACLFRRVKPLKWNAQSYSMPPERFENFYGRENPLNVRYIREVVSLNYGKAEDRSYGLEELKGGKDG